MALRFRNMSTSDYQKVGTMLQCNTGRDSFKILEENTFYSSGEDSVTRGQANAHMRQVIQLTSPTFNYVLCESGGTLLKKMLNVPQDQWKSIVNMDVMYDLTDDCEVKLNDADSTHKLLMGAEYAKYLIDKLDIETELIKCLYGAFYEVLKTSASDPRQYVAFNKNKKGFEVGGGYYCEVTNDALLDDNLKRGVNREEVPERVVEALFAKNSTRFTYLYNMPKDKSALYGMLNQYIVVVPEGMRPKIKNERHALTKLYANLVRANIDLQYIKGYDATVKDVREKYLNLDRCTMQLQYDNHKNNKAAKPDEKALLERVKSKKGQVRMYNLGKRQDYSGRAVVCINPYLPVDTCRIPREMIIDLLQFHVLPYLSNKKRINNIDKESNNHIQDVYDTIRLSNLTTKKARDECMELINKHHLLDDIPFIIGRQPTLHKQSLQGLYVEESKFNAIEMNPLVCPAFNMDFDGDQGHSQVALLMAAIKETRDLLLTTQNLFLAKNGECTTEPRQDMLYGLYMCTRDDYAVGADVANGSFENAEAVRQAVMDHKVKVWQTVNVQGFGSVLAGDISVIACMPDGYVTPRGKSGGFMSIIQITSKTIGKYMDAILQRDANGNLVLPIGKRYAPTNTVIGTINRLVELGFKVARLYPTNMSMTAQRKSIPEFDDAIKNFHEDMKEINMYYGLGLETSDNYKIEFDRYLGKMTDAQDKHLFEKLGEDSGYVLLCKSGARGSKSNLTQAFACKGRVKKNSIESFDALLEGSYGKQLTPLEAMMAAYGGRQGMIDKSLKTGDTGYAMRQMWHCTQGLTITCDDCGTSDGITISKQFLTLLANSNVDASAINSFVEQTFEHVLEGRYIVGEGKPVTVQRAHEMATDPSCNEVKIRTPLKCKNPCCAKCYGVDWSTGRTSIPGTPVGLIAAQSIGEPGTQLTLKTFQTGGVAGKGEVTSTFDKVKNYLLMVDLHSKYISGEYAGYDPIAWADGKVITELTSDVNIVKVKIEGYKGKSIKLRKGIELKKEVKRGEGLLYRHGDFDIHEMLKYNGLETAQLYTAMKLYALYSSEVKIKTIHFETLVAEMTRYMITRTDRSDLRVGQYCTASELYRGSIAGTKWIPRIINVRDSIRATLDALDCIDMEYQVKGLSRICLLQLQDTLTKPLNRMTMGLAPLTAKAYPDYIKLRKEVI